MPYIDRFREAGLEEVVERGADQSKTNGGTLIFFSEDLEYPENHLFGEVSEG